MACKVLGPVGSVTVALAVALAVLPVNAVLMAELAMPKAGVTVMVMVLPTGTPVV